MNFKSKTVGLLHRMESDSQLLKVRSVKGEHTWVIEGFSMLDASVGNVVKSEEFSLLRHKWMLEFAPGGKMAEYAGFLSLMLYVHDGACSCRYRLAVVDKSGKEIAALASSGTRLFSHSTRKGWGFGNLLERSLALDTSKDDDTLRVKVTIECAEQERISLPCVPKGTWHENVLRDMGKLLEQGKHSDVTLVVEGTEIPAHRNILSARSPFFEAMFSHKMSESLEGVVHFDDIALPVFQQLLKFLYTGACSFETEYSKAQEKKNQQRKSSKEEKQDACGMLSQLLAAADKFQIPELVGLCMEKLAGDITTENAAERIMLADSCHAPDLKKWVMDFVRADSKRLAEVMDTDAFQKLRPAQLHELLAIYAHGSGKKRPREEDSLAAASLSQPQVKKLKVSELRAELESRGLETSGLKPELVERLENALG